MGYIVDVRERQRWGRGDCWIGWTSTRSLGVIGWMQMQCAAELRSTRLRFTASFESEREICSAWHLDPVPPLSDCQSQRNSQGIQWFWIARAGSTSHTHASSSRASASKCKCVMYAGSRVKESALQVYQKDLERRSEF